MRKTAVKLTSFLLAACLLLALAPLSGFGIFLPVRSLAATTVDSGTCGENVSWTLDSDGTLTISGTGPMRNYLPLGNASSPFQENSSIKNVVIVSGVTSIGKCAFTGCTGLTNVTIPNSVMAIEVGAFSGCTGLTNVTIPNSVMTIAVGAFSGCAGLTSVTVAAGNTVYHSAGNCIIETQSKTLIFGCKTGVIPSDGSVTVIGMAAFSGCAGLTSVTIPASVTDIEDAAFSGCADLTTVTVAEGNTVYHSAGNCIIETDSKTLIFGCKTGVIPSDGSVTGIGDKAFSGCTGLKGVTIPNSVTSIGDNAFTGCTGLKTVAIPNSVTSIGGWAFSHCAGLTRVTIPSSVTSIGYAAFYECESFTDVYYTGSEEQWNAASNVPDHPEAFELSFAHVTVHYNYDPVHEHVWDEGEINTPATCGAAGEKTYVCTVCGVTKTETVAATGEHVWNGGEITTPATLTEAGEKTFTCTVCGATRTEPVEKLTEQPKIDSDRAKEQNGNLYSAPELTAGELLALAGEGASVKDQKGASVAADKPLGSGMTLTKADGTALTVVVKGDNDGDGAITSADARFALRTAVELETPDGWRLNASLVAGGTEVTSADARAILRAAVELDTLPLI